MVSPLPLGQFSIGVLEMVSISLVSAILPMLPGIVLAAIADTPGSIVGTYNVSFLMGAAPMSFVQSVCALFQIYSYANFDH
jgi:hypothetical protein